jgi:hypothetical protein
VKSDLICPAQPVSCSFWHALNLSIRRNWVAECLWDKCQGEWTWQYKTAAGDLRLHADTDPCSEKVVCKLPQFCGTATFQDTADNSTILNSTVALGTKVFHECDLGYTGSGTFECTDSCNFSPTLKPCSKVVCKDLLSDAAFDFSSASADNLDFTKQYILSDSIQVKCPEGETTFTTYGNGSNLQCIKAGTILPSHRSRRECLCRL